MSRLWSGRPREVADRDWLRGEGYDAFWFGAFSESWTHRKKATSGNDPIHGTDPVIGTVDVFTQQNQGSVLIWPWLRRDDVSLITPPGNN
ncbi:hypothetical protein HJFPF1_02221 [Paramyrothecium foliicola]|nr:hypothetical protein HJFPF1_02221 [Paramyrothecium foliicola]